MLYISARTGTKEAWRREGSECETPANVVAMRVCLHLHPRKRGRVGCPQSPPSVGAEQRRSGEKIQPCGCCQLLCDWGKPPQLRI